MSIAHEAMKEESSVDLLARPLILRCMTLNSFGIASLDGAEMGAAVRSCELVGPAAT